MSEINETKLEADNSSSGDITFLVDNEKVEILKLCSNGDIYVRGRLATNDLEVVEGLRYFLINAKIKE
jgi:hypothetical protein